MKILSSIYIILLLYFSYIHNLSSQNNRVIVGAEKFEEYLPLLMNKKVGIVANHTSMVGKTHLIDTLISLKVDITKIFSPEHGFKGDIERGIYYSDEYIKLKSKEISLISLYGKNRIPSDENMKGIEIMIYDIQDVGARFYTYLSTMHNIIEACAKNKVPIIILDRPNPNGHYVDGPVLEIENKSFVGMHPIPIVHGCTLGEMAQMIVGEKWLINNEKIDLKIIKIQNWNHKKRYNLPVRPSPNLPNQQSILLYPSLCLFEQTPVSIGRGTDFPFQVIGHPDYRNLEFGFTPSSVLEESNPKFKNVKCFGKDLRKINIKSEIDLSYIIHFYKELKNNGSDFFNDYFYRLAGTKQLRKQIESDFSEAEIKKSWNKNLEKYKIMRKKYLLYKDFE